MPIPNPKGGESQNEFVSRCVSQISNEYPQDQALAICINKFEENMSKTTQQTVNQKIARMSKLRGINLNPDGSYDMKEPCWDGYEQYGTKIVDGREVPNCIPID
jgi:hypothetical protein